MDIWVLLGLGWLCAGTSQGTSSFWEGVLSAGRPSAIGRVSGMGSAALGHPTGIAGKAPQEALESTWRMRTIKKFSLDSTAEPTRKKISFMNYDFNLAPA